MRIISIKRSLFAFLCTLSLQVGASDIYMGYMGKRISIQADFGYAPNLLGTLNKNFENNILKSTVKKQWGLMYLSNPKSAFTYAYSNQDFAFNSDFRLSTTIGQSVANYSLDKAMMNVKSHYLGYRYYKHHCAPIGPFLGISMSAHKLQSKENNGFLLTPKENDAPQNMFFNASPLNLLGIGIQSGQTIHLVETLFLDFSVEGNLIFGLNGDKANQLQRDMNFDLLIRHIMNFKIGLKYFL